MKWFVFIGICLVLFSINAQAETMYVNDILEITLRTGPGTDRKIIALLKSDQALEVLKHNKEWSQVRLPDGTEGWVVRRFLKSAPPNRLVMKNLKQENEELKAKAASLFEENDKHKAENLQLNSDLSKNKEALSRLNESYEQLKKESSEFLKLKADYKNSTEKLVEQTQKAEKFEKELMRIQLHQNIKWFLSGAGVLILGIIIGLSTKRQRRRTSLL
ncbi:MAG: TIGR04211 family SH3 domain-containing protein [Desulfobacterales bacterium]|nr:TIGR04211 family SH3 domain-containing protein [Desulfobacterales bacterium]